MSYLNQEKIMIDKSYSQVALFFRSVLFLILSNAAIIIYCFFVIAALPFPLRYRHAIIRHFFRLFMFMLKTICLIDYEIEGIENVPKNRNGIVLSKHQSTWETFFIPMYFHDPAAIAKRELLWIPFFGWGLAASKPITINRSSKTSAMQQIIKKGKEYLDAGRWIMVFPEGTRMPVGVVGHYKLGGARLASATGYPVVPVAHNAGIYWPKRKFIKNPGTIRVVIGPLIESKGKEAEDILNEAKTWIENTMTRINRLVDEPPGK